MYYSFDFAANVTRLCMDEIRERGLQERKIFRKTMPNSGLFIKVFSKQTCTKQDLSYVHIHSVATLMQDALWSTHERILSKKSWRLINYETCTLSNLSSVITSKGERLLIDILDFLVELMQYKSVNLMDAYKLGDALGKVVLGPADCGLIMTEKAGHFLTRMIIEHAKIMNQRGNNKHQQQLQVIRRIDSGFDQSPSYSYHSFYSEHRPICKAQGTRARAKCYDRVIIKTRWTSYDWLENTTGVQELLDDAYEFAPDPPEKPWISIFTSTDLLLKPHKDMVASPVLYRILREASKPVPRVLSDPFAASYLFNTSKAYWAERQIHEAFTEFNSHLYTSDKLGLYESADRSSPLKRLNHSISHIKLNIKKYRSRHDLLDESTFSEDTDATMINGSATYMSVAELESKQSQEHVLQQQQQQMFASATNNVKNAMKKMIKMGGISQHVNRDNKLFA